MSTIYNKGNVLGKTAGPFHGLFLQLLANDIVELSVDKNKTKHIGPDKLLAKHIVVKLGQVNIGNGVKGLAILQRSSWADITCI